MRIIDAGAPAEGQRVVHSQIRTWANFVTLLRLAGLPLSVWLIIGANNDVAGLIVLLLIGGTDWVDGYLARKLDQVTHLGIALDPIVDRVMILTVTITFAFAVVAPWWLVPAVLIPDAALATYTMVKFGRSAGIPATVLGKVRIALLMLGLPLILFGTSFVGPDSVIATIGWAVTIAGCVGHWIVAVHYGRIMMAMPARA